MKNCIWVTTNFEGFHKYRDAPDEVAFLRNEHRHIFYIKVYIEVFHNDRDIEFFMFKNYVNSILLEKKLNNMSCEMISDILAEKIQKKYNNRNVIIEVSEDGENGSYKEYIP